MSGSEHDETRAGPRVLSREPELLMLRRFLGGGPVTYLVLSGEAGIGKTTLWEVGLETAEAQGYVVLSARASEAEVGLSFAALADLVDGIDPDLLSSLPAPQLHALEVALRRRDPIGAGPDPFAIAAGLLSALRALSERVPLLVAIDDVQWLDASSANALSFAARRISGERARFLVTRREGQQSELEQAVQPHAVLHHQVAPLSFGATGRVLSERLGLGLTHRVLRHVHQTSGGNPLFALELGRLLATGGVPEVGSELPVPDLVGDLFGPRVRGLPDPVRGALLAVALSAGMSQSELSMVVDPLAVEDAVASGLLVIDRSHVRPAHPMLAAAAVQHSTARERRGLHLALASAVSDATLRARHLATATAAPDAELAMVVAASAELAAKRGAVQDAEELAAHALRLTPPEAPESADRVLDLARAHTRADEMTRVTDLLTRAMDKLPAGRARAFAHLMLGEAADAPGNAVHAELALAEAGEDPEVRALAMSKKSRLLSLSSIERIDEAEAWALEAMSAAQMVGADIEDRARAALAWARVLRGRPIDDLAPPDNVSRSAGWHPESSIERPLAARLAFRGQLEEARAIFQQMLVLADERGDVQVSRMVQQQLCEVELRAGNVREAGRLLDELDQGPHWMVKVRARLHALLASEAGDLTGATRWAAAVLDAGSGHVQGWDRLDATRALGLAALLEQDASRAVESLQAVWEHTVREHVDDPGAFPVAADLVEALVRSHHVESANDVTERLRHAATHQRHPWGLASARRCAAVVQLAERYDERAAKALEGAAADYATLGLHFDRARTLLLLGEFQRRSQKRADARRSLEQATAQFEQCGCLGWAARARSELARVSGRRSTGDGELTPSERQVVELAASGLSNKEIASHLFVTVYTVEAHLTHAYAKLGVRSRAQLASILRETDGQ